MYGSAAEKLTRLTDRCEYPYCQAIMPLCHWERRALHITRHCDLKAAAALIQLIGKEAPNLRYKFGIFFTRSGSLGDLEQTLTSFYGRNYSLESLVLPWTPQRSDWDPVRSFPEEKRCRIPRGHTNGRGCCLCKSNGHRCCPLCKLYMGRSRVVIRGRRRQAPSRLVHLLKI